MLPEVRVAFLLLVFYLPGSNKAAPPVRFIEVLTEVAPSVCYILGSKMW